MLILKSLFVGLLGPALVNGFIGALIASCIIIIFVNNYSMRKGSWLIGGLILMLIGKAIVQLFMYAYIPLEYVIISLLPKLIILLLAFTMLNMPSRNIQTLRGVLKKIACISFLFAGIELMLPDELTLEIISKISNAKLIVNEDLTAYKDVLFGFERSRLGSIFFEPITFGMFSVILLCCEVFEKNVKKDFWYINILILNIILSGAKSAILFFLIVAVYHRIGFIKATLITIGIVCLIVYMASPMAAINAAELTAGVESIANHIIGLVFGVTNSLEFPLLGHGMGTAGYLIYLTARASGSFYPFKNNYGIFEPLENGNESAVGVFFYENGLIPGLILVGTMLYIAYSWHRRKSSVASGMLVSYFCFALFSESSLSVAIVTVLIFAITKYYINNDPATN